INQLYLLIPDKYSGGLLIVILISIAKLTDNVLGNNNAILFNSRYYKVALVFGILLMVAMVVLNTIFIPKFGINGAAFATFIAVIAYNLLKVVFVRYSFETLPFTVNSLKVLVLIVICFVVFYFWDFRFYPILNILLKSGLVTVVYGYVIYYFNISDEVTLLIKKWFNRFV